MKFIIGENPHVPGGWQILGNDGVDLTEQFRVKRLECVVDGSDRDLTVVRLEVYADVEIAPGKCEIVRLESPEEELRRVVKEGGHE